MGKRFEYKTVHTSLEDLQVTLNQHAEEGFKAVHFHHPAEDKVFVVLGRKFKHKKHHHHDEYEEEDD